MLTRLRHLIVDALFGLRAHPPERPTIRDVRELMRDLRMPGAMFYDQRLHYDAHPNPLIQTTWTHLATGERWSVFTQVDPASLAKLDYESHAANVEARYLAFAYVQNRQSVHATN